MEIILEIRLNIHRKFLQGFLYYFLQGYLYNFFQTTFNKFFHCFLQTISQIFFQMFVQVFLQQFNQRFVKNFYRGFIENFHIILPINLFRKSCRNSFRDTWIITFRFSVSDWFRDSCKSLGFPPDIPRSMPQKLIRHCL